MYKYKIEINWSEEDQVYLASVPELKGCITHGATHQQALQMAHEAIECYLEGLKSRSLPIPVPMSEKSCSGKISLRVSPNLHRELLVKAEMAGKSLNAYIAENLESITG